jgi:endo-1,3-1,4-beta-glycanase ExoK
MSSLGSMWWTSGTYANGYPFASGWDPSFYPLDPNEGLVLKAKRQTFYNPMATSPETSKYEFTSAELRSVDFYGYGCFSACMKPAKASGVSSSFFVYNGPTETPADATRVTNGMSFVTRDLYLLLPFRSFQVYLTFH